MKEFRRKVDAWQGEVLTTLTLPLDLRQKSRQRVTLDNGEEAGLFLPRGTALKAGDHLVSENESTAVKVQAAAENLSLASCESTLLFARACYHLGNRHMPLQIEEGRILYLHDHVLDDMLRGLGLEVERVSAPFEPEPGAYGGSAAQAGHHHDH